MEREVQFFTHVWRLFKNIMVRAVQQCESQHTNNPTLRRFGGLASLAN